MKSTGRILIPMMALLFISCAKEKPYDELVKLDVSTGKQPLSRSAIKISETKEIAKGEFYTRTDGTRGRADKNKKLTVAKKYLYVPMTLGTPREVVEADPFYQGQEKLVRLEWSNDGLEVIEMEKDERFSSNDLNDTPVLTIPGDFVSYRCREDSYGKCTNVEEENNEIPLLQRSHFKPDFSGLKVREVNELDVYTISESSCVSHIDTKLVNSEVSNGVINIQLEKTYKLRTSFSCIWSNYINDKFSYNSFKVRFFYSIVELDQLIDKNYEPVAYPTPDHSKFGFFKDEKLVLDDNFDSQRMKKVNYLNRFSPKRKGNKLVYHLSDTFNKPENLKLKAATYKAISIMNKGMKKGNVPFKIHLEEPSGKIPGDLRNNMIVLIDDPLANGLLGYGPSVTNPETGEIVQAHTNMYSGVLKTMTRRVWESAADLSEEQTNKPAETLTDINVAASALQNLPERLALQNIEGFAPATISEADKEEEETTSSRLSQQVENISNLLHSGHIPDVANIRMDVDSLKTRLAKRRLNSRNLKLEQVYRNLDDDSSELEKRVLKEDARLQRYAENNAFATEFFPIGGTSKVIYPELKAISGVLTPQGSLKRWGQLTQAQQDAAREMILERTYMATLIHELGHNLGMRHNFSGSFDKENFLTQAEVNEYSLDAVPAYSSVMDYSFSEFNQLQAFGKYDIAALSFAYAREVELKDGKKIKVKTPLTELDEALEANGLERKSYMFCTDENAGLSSTCNRFDEGTSLVEIAKFRIKRYKDAYKYRNFRDERLNFSSHDMWSYAVWRMRELRQIRDIMEDYEFFAGIFGPGLMAQGCTPDQVKQYPVCAMINDRRDSTRLVGDFFLEILKTPDHICALARADKPNIIVSYKKLGEIYDDLKFSIDHVTTTCFDKAVKNSVSEMDIDGDNQPDNLIVIGENGKFLNGFKDNDPNFNYASDRAVRGVFIDKLVAAEALFARRWRNWSTDESHMALVDIPYVFNKVAPFIGHLTLGMQIQEPVPFKTENGKTFAVPYAISDDYKLNPLEDYMTPLKREFGLPEQGYGNLVESILAQVSKSGVNYGEDYSNQAYATVNFSSVEFQNISSSNGHPDFVQISDYNYYAGESNVIAGIILNSIKAYDYLSKLTEEQITDLITRITAGEDVELNFDPSYIGNFVSGNLTENVVNFYKKKLKQMKRHQYLK